MQVAIPHIETPRLLLRPHRLEDFRASVAMWSDPAVVRYITGTPSTPQATWFRLLRYAGHWPLMSYGYWAIEDNASGDFLGEVGFANFKRDIEPSIADTPEVGWVLAAPAHGRGYATEAVRAALLWADAHLTERRTVCIVNPENRQSVRIALKCGFTQYAEATIGGQPVLMFERMRANVQ